MKKYTIAKYIRLSMEDLDLCDSEEKAESVSISNQRNYQCFYGAKGRI